jgi:hypothetical protein
MTNILLHIDQLLGKEHETNNETKVVVRHQSARNPGSIVGGGVSCVVSYEAISRDRPSSVNEWS